MKKPIMFFMIGFLLSVGVVFVLGGIGTTFHWTHGSTNFSNRAIVQTGRTVVLGIAEITSSVNETWGNLGARVNIHNDSWHLIDSSAWSFNSSTTRFHSHNFSISNPPIGNYCSQGETAFYRNGGYTYVWTWCSPFQGFPGY
ncbi:MAG: hypothetical protein FWE27_03215 [Defluviitaleaceae bacterium]|nr:hypothetical protein [Defluviitaleaceae bacterium]